MDTGNVHFFVGLDVHKRSTDYAVRDRVGTVVLEGRCASACSDLVEVLGPYLCSCVVGVECNVEVYPIHAGFLERAVDVRVANTVQLRTLVAKNDRLDARRLSDMLRLGTFPEAFIPDETLKRLRSGQLGDVLDNGNRRAGHVETLHTAICHCIGDMMATGTGARR